ncbi:MAG TPA: acetoacetate decarboxylase family protein [Deltaproteobacteria bacterium]|nr:acetoacetate decarboxylase family protein [Deltaproteobacteria bacterium]
MDEGSVISAPAPWVLTGQGCIALVRLSRDFVEEQGFVPDALKGRFAGGVGMVMYVDYRSSDVGPYREILFIPGMFDVGGRKYFSISRIFVSTLESVVNGRRNWGIPKELAVFEVSREGGVESVRMSRDGRQFAELRYRALPFSVPVTTALVPRGLRTLVHLHEGRTYLTTPGARGAVSPARLVHARIDGAVFPDFSQCRILGTFAVPKFLMTFPEAVIL